ncbi:13298_t:CDS:2 [Cetraspora pellucida]|uniref:13298_t:CDS:1 n=1 Tax=Cetraspora pellucida TaxID=1433469 RepID=A0A9N9FFJ0_9GLOM|nr:13298_t:CDS:2 [Cetraspora pellucida]
MILYKYNAHIQEQQKEHKIKDTILLNFFKLNLKGLNLYINTLQQVYKNSLLNSYLTNNIIPIVADWSEQVFTQQAITFYLQNYADNNSLQDQQIVDKDDILEVLQKNQLALPIID